jgi:hypothetical protein
MRLIGSVLPAGMGLLLFLYVLFPVETTTWLTAHLRSRPASFCHTARGASPSRFHLNKGQCDGALKEQTSDAGLGDLWLSVRTVLAQRASR